MRRVIQLATNSVEDVGCYIFALCNDGSMWGNFTTANGFEGWEQLDPVPQASLPSGDRIQKAIEIIKGLLETDDREKAIVWLKENGF